jgi:hypothetical protein
MSIHPRSMTVGWISCYANNPAAIGMCRSSRYETQGTSGYIFFPKAKFRIRPDLLAAVAVFVDGREPDLFLLHATRWLHQMTHWLVCWLTETMWV